MPVRDVALSDDYFVVATHMLLVVCNLANGERTLSYLIIIPLFAVLHVNHTNFIYLSA
jgi:hypothetical protein